LSDSPLLETSIDDMNPQIFGYLFERLLSAGALDAFCTPIIMKKNRPATMLGVLCRPENATALLDIVFTETTTLGVRRRDVDRISAGRNSWTVETPLGPVRVKVKERGGRVLAAMPEYEDCVELARQHSRPLLEVIEIARRAAGARKDEV